MNLDDGCCLGLGEVRHPPRNKAERSNLKRLQCTEVNAVTHSQRPSALNDKEILVLEMCVRKNHKAGIVLNANDKGRASSVWITPYCLQPTEVLQRHDAVGILRVTDRIDQEN